MTLQSTIATFSLLDHEAMVDHLHYFIVSNANGIEVFRHYLVESPLGLSIVERDSYNEIQIGSYPIQPTDIQTFLNPGDQFAPFRVVENSSGLGVGDIRDHRIGRSSYLFDLISKPIQLESDGLYLGIKCPGGSDNADWRQQISSEEAKSFLGLPCS